MHECFSHQFRLRTTFKKSGCFAALIFLLGFAPGKSFADDVVASRFTNSITTMYTFSQECLGTLAPGPEEYIKLITDYLNILYPRGIVYWAMPAVTQHIKDRGRCIVAVQGHLLEYRQASLDYQEDYPDQPTPPLLLAYNWGDSGTLNYSAPIVPETPKAAPKEVPRSIWTGGKL